MITLTITKSGIDCKNVTATFNGNMSNKGGRAGEGLCHKNDDNQTK
jgi:hypothetical protein